MSNKEIVDRGISFSGDYNHYPPYQQGCETQDSYLTIAGNYLNNNSKIHCVVLGTVPLPPYGGNTTSTTATLTVEGQLNENFMVTLAFILTACFSQVIQLISVTFK